MTAFSGPGAEQSLAGELVEALSLPIWQAAAAVHWLEGRVGNNPKAESSAEKSALTDADCVSQEIIVTALARYFPFVRLDAEEDTPAAKAFAANDSEYTVRVDPIDGTLRYIRQDGLYAILIGLEREGRVEGALVALPQEGIVARAVRGGGAEVSIDGGEFAPARLHPGGRRVLVSYGVTDATRQRLERRGLRVVTAAGGGIGIAPLLEGTRGALRSGDRAGGLSPRAWVAALPLLEAGGVVRAFEGDFPERYRPGVSGMVVAAAPDEADELLATLP